MKLLLSILAIIFIQPSFSEENKEKFCVVDTKTEKSFLKTIEKCKEGDGLALGFSRGGVDMFNFTNSVARACKIDTVQISYLGGVCIYRGELREAR